MLADIETAFPFRSSCCAVHLERNRARAACISHDIAIGIRLQNYGSEAVREVYHDLFCASITAIADITF